MGSKGCFKGDLMGGLTVLAVVIVAYTLVASKLDRWWITGPMVFVAAGVILGPGGLDVLPLSLTNETVVTVTELTLALLLFSDASTVRLGDVEGDAGLPRRLLFIGLPLTVLAGALLAYLMFPKVGWAAAALVASILAPTDAAPPPEAAWQNPSSSARRSACRHRSWCGRSSVLCS